MKISLEQVSSLVLLPLTKLRQEYPNHVMHLFNGPQDLASPKVLHPVFYGCYDWHSAVHGYWLLAYSAQHYPNLIEQNAIADLFSEHFTAEKMAQELAYFQADGRQSYERPYGWAWLFALAQTLASWKHPQAASWLAHLMPLVEFVRARSLVYLTELTYPIRNGAHYNSAFAMKLMLDYARQQHDTEMAVHIENAARRYFAADQSYPAHYEPSGDEFLSAALTEAVLMASVLPIAEFTIWFDAYLPTLIEIKQLNQPAEVSNRSDPKIAHLDGLNLSRAWCMRYIATQLPDGIKKQHLLTVAENHLAASLPFVASGHYEGEHWLATFAMLALDV